MWCYRRTEPLLFTVGFYDPQGKWHTDSDHNSKAEAASRVSFLNGNQGADVAWPGNFRVYGGGGGGQYLATTMHAEDAAVLVAAVAGYVMHAGMVVFRQGEDGDAARSYDVAANTMHQRIAGRKV